ncbi:unnamed protein product [Echinostoma caproni]|uniref:DHC_N1 domain-containing protein n=1 Tax=Echinostoma caproni TaxID=27848 RepID=A0A183AHT1_9TREM|nr:unnamed protein product [Echinostoma caproni]
MVSFDTSRAFLNIVCKNLGFADPLEAIEDFLSRDSSVHRSLLKTLFGDSSSSSNSDPYGTPFGLAFYKSIVTDRRLFKIPTTYGTTVLRKQRPHEESTHTSQKSFTEAGTFTVLGVSEFGGTQRASIIGEYDRQLTTKVPSARESIISAHGITATSNTTETDATTGGANNPPQQNQYILVARMYPRECLMVMPLSVFGSGKVVNEENLYFFAIRNKVARATMDSALRTRQATESSPSFSSHITTGCLRGSLLECAHRLFSKVFLRLLAYYMQRKEMYSETEGLDGAHSKPGNGSRDEDSTNSTNPSGESKASDTRAEHQKPLRTAHPSSGGGGSISIGNGGGSGEEGTKFGSGHTEDTQRLRDEFSVTLFKFSTVLEETITALQGVFNLEEPDFMPSDDYQIDPSRDYLMIPKISKLFRVWDDQIDQVLTNLDKPRPISSGPLEEVDYWRYRCKVLTAVAEALRTKTARWVIDAWSVLCPDATPYGRGAEIKALMLEAKDNSR